MRIRTDVKSPADIWRGDKKLLRSHKPEVPIDWYRGMPASQDAHNILVSRTGIWNNPPDPVELDGALLKDTLDWMIPDLQSVWGEKLEEPPQIELLPPSGYLARFIELQKETNAQFGSGIIIDSPSTAYLSPFHGRIILPQKCMFRTPKADFKYTLENMIMSGQDLDVTEKSWDLPFFEEVLYEEMSHALFRQIRGEWKFEYVRCMTTVGPNIEACMSTLNELFAQYAKDTSALRSRRNWGLHIVAEKIVLVWQNMERMNTYRAIDALARSGYKLGRIAMIDGVSYVNNDYVDVLFEGSHPYHARKLAKFNLISSP